MSLQVNLHNHSERSFLDGYARIPDMVRRVKELGQEYVALTDHGEVSGHLALAKETVAQGLQAIYGMEGYFTTDLPGCLSKQYKKVSDAPISHICLLAADNQGLSNLWALSSIAYDHDHHWNKPLADVELLRTYSAGIYASDGCMLTEFADTVELGDEDGARQILGTLLDVYRERFYMELHTWQYLDDEVPERMAFNARMRRLNQAKVRFATELGVPLVVVNDSHHAYPDDWYNKELVWQFNTGQNPDQVGEVAQKADHLMGEDELFYYMDRHGVSRETVAEAIKNSHAIAESCRVQIRPTLGVPQLAASEHDDLASLIDACEQGFRRYVTDEGLDEDRYYDRMEEELRLIADKGFAGYFNMVRDYTMAYRSGAWSQYVKKGAAKDPKLLGPGRGSVGGSLVGYLTGIDVIDPVKYGTLFSRFLTPERKGLPDVDLDVPQSDRQDMLAYINKRFGHENVCAIGTFSRNGPKQTLRDLGRVFKIDRPDLDAMSEHIAAVERMKNPDDPDEAELTWEELIERKGGELKPWAARYPELFAKMEEMTGLIRHSGVHAAGVLVSSVPLLGAVPMRRTKNKAITTQFDMWEIEELGGVKIDLLGLRHLDTLSVARRLIHERHGLWVDYDRSGLSVPAGCGLVVTFGDTQFRDPAIWGQIDKGQTTGIFQMETSFGTDAAIQFKPRSEVDVADLSAIVRPGVSDAGLKDVYLRRRAGLEPVLYDHPLMEAIVGPKWATDTFGILVYQEQLIECVQQLASFTADEADTLRKVVGKKQMAQLMAFKDKFIDGCQRNYDFALACGDPANQTLNEKRERQVAEKIWASIEASGRYAFNWSHAVGYAMISTWEIWTKHYYPQEFTVALMATDSANINKYIREARRKAITILPPDINRSDRKFTIEDEAIRYGLDTVRSVGKAASRDILAARPYVSLEDYLARAKEGADKGVVRNLILIGAFDSLGSRPEILGQLERLRAMEGLAESTLTNAEKLTTRIDLRLTQNPAKWAIEIPDFDDPEVMCAIEKDLVGTYVTVDPMEPFLEMMDGCISDPADMYQIPRGNTFFVGGQIAAISETVTKKGKSPGAHMAHLTLSWNEAEFRIVCFPDSWARCAILLKNQEGRPVACKVKKLDSGASLETVVRLDLLDKRERA